jgi:hypothetical protein
VELPGVVEIVLAEVPEKIVVVFAVGLGQAQA